MPRIITRPPVSDRAVLLVALAVLLVLPACSMENSSKDCDDFDGVVGSCRCRKSDSRKDIRLHFVNSENVANIALSIDTPDGSCSIGQLPTSTVGGLELAQAVFTLTQGQVITMNAQSPSGGVTGACRVTSDALTFMDDGDPPNSIFIDILITQGLIICSEGVEPVDDPGDT